MKIQTKQCTCPKQPKDKNKQIIATDCPTHAKERTPKWRGYEEYTQQSRKTKVAWGKIKNFVKWQTGDRADKDIAQVEKMLP